MTTTDTEPQASRDRAAPQTEPTPIRHGVQGLAAAIGELASYYADLEADEPNTSLTLVGPDGTVHDDLGLTPGLVDLLTRLVRGELDEAAGPAR